ncbi:hypothetical protein C4D60_Mb09t07040 [Musa balbisiana]|uniref:SPARK domain-containing protein n=1 Tax=Musa balbisiana TaxID=52838 RepID=A0A4S8IFE1_MUSBA|nr:hypothetical protein C4D60_Mb09t07040 [Musa balbisiana]
MAGSNEALPRLCFLGLLLCLCYSSAAAASTPDLLYLNLLWPGGYCQSVNLGENCCIPTTGEPAADFLVQSLETYDSTSGNPITNCNSDCRFLINPLAELIEDLFAYWPSLSCPSNNGMEQWKHVWCTYGNCTSLSEVVYFNRTLLLREQANILATLKSCGIVPHASITYSLKEIAEALATTLGSSSFSVECERRYTVWPLLYQDYLTRIRICVSSDATTFVSCPTYLTTNCGNTVKFAPILYPSSRGRQGDATTNPVRLPSAMMDVFL